MNRVPLLLAASLVVAGLASPAAASTTCTGGTRLAEIYEGDDGAWPTHVVIDTVGTSEGATVLCVYTAAVADSYRAVGGAVILRGYELPPGTVPAVTTDVSGCGPMQTLAAGEIGDPGGPAHLPYRIAASVDTGPTVCVLVNGTGLRVSYAAGGVGSPPSVSFEQDPDAVRPARPAYPAQDALRPSTSCFYGDLGRPYRRYAYVLLPGVRAYYATESDSYYPGYDSTCYRVEGPDGTYRGAAWTRGQQPPLFLPSVALSGDRSRCTANLASAEAPVPYSFRYGTYRDASIYPEHHAVCVAVAGTELLLDVGSGTVAEHLGGAEAPLSWQYDSR